MALTFRIFTCELKAPGYSLRCLAAGHTITLEFSKHKREREEKGEKEGGKEGEKQRRRKRKRGRRGKKEKGTKWSLMCELRELCLNRHAAT